jgi:hypothetical protein
MLCVARDVDWRQCTDLESGTRRRACADAKSLTSLAKGLAPSTALLKSRADLEIGTK